MPELQTPVFVTIDYVDAEGRKSRRKIEVFLTEEHRDFTMLAAWCQSKEDVRHFRSDRIISVTTARGEVIGADDFIARLLPGRQQWKQVMAMREAAERAQRINARKNLAAVETDDEPDDDWDDEEDWEDSIELSDPSLFPPGRVPSIAPPLAPPPPQPALQSVPDGHLVPEQTLKEWLFVVTESLAVVAMTLWALFSLIGAVASDDPGSVGGIFLLGCVPLFLIFTAARRRHLAMKQDRLAQAKAPTDSPSG